MKKNLLLTTVCCLFLTAGCATQSDLYRLDDRLSVLEQDQARTQRSKTQMEQRLQDSSQRAQKLREQFAGLYAAIDRIQAEMQQLTGKIEESAYSARSELESIDDGRAQLDKRMETLNERLLSLQGRLEHIEEYLNLESATKSKTPAASKPAAGGAAVSENALYGLAKKAYDQGENETALADFQRFVAKYPKSANADNALFWMGEIYYREKWYEKAILEYQKVIEKYPKGNKVQASLLKQGLAFHALGDKANARLILKELISKYPKSSEAQIAGQKLKTF